MTDTISHEKLKLHFIFVFLLWVMFVFSLQSEQSWNNGTSIQMCLPPVKVCKLPYVFLLHRMVFCLYMLPCTCQNRNFRHAKYDFIVSHHRCIVSLARIFIIEIEIITWGSLTSNVNQLIFYLFTCTELVKRQNYFFPHPFRRWKQFSASGQPEEPKG